MHGALLTEEITNCSGINYCLSQDLYAVIIGTQTLLEWQANIDSFFRVPLLMFSATIWNNTDKVLAHNACSLFRVRYATYQPLGKHIKFLLDHLRDCLIKKDVIGVGLPLGTLLYKPEQRGFQEQFEWIPCILFVDGAAER